MIGKIFGILIVAGAAFGGWYVYNAPQFEREKPQIHTASKIYWNIYC